MTTTTVTVEKLKYMFSTTGGVESFRASGDQHVIRNTLVTFLIFFFLMRTWKKMCLVFVFFGSWVSRVCRPTERKDIDPRVFLCM